MRGKSIVVTGIMATALAVGAVPARAQQAAEFTIAAGQPYRHQPTGFTVPAVLDGLTRVKATQLEPDQLDDYINFDSPDGGDEITVYVFRHVTGSVPVWFDRTRWAIEHRGDVYGTVTALDRPIPFVPPGQNNASGLTLTYLTGKGPYRSTAVAMMPLGPGWFVNVRYTSRTHSAEALEPRLKAVVAALGWPATIEPQPDAAPIGVCADALAIKGKAKPVAGAGADFLGAALLDFPIAEIVHPNQPPPVWCRDSTRLKGMETSGVYRANSAIDSYLIAVGDAGRGVSVGPSIGNEIVPADGKKRVPQWNVRYVDMHVTTAFRPQDRLPSPDQAVEIVQKGPYTTRTTTWGDKKEVTVNSDVLH